MKLSALSVLTASSSSQLPPHWGFYRLKWKAGWVTDNRNSPPPTQNGSHFGRGHFFKCIFSNWNDKIPILISLKLVPKSSIENKPALFLVMVWRRTGDKPLPEPMMDQFTDAYVQHYGDELLRYFLLIVNELECDSHRCTWFQCKRRVEYYHTRFLTTRFEYI